MTQRKRGLRMVKTKMVEILMLKKRPRQDNEVYNVLDGGASSKYVTVPV